MWHLDHVEWEVSYGETTNLIVFPVPDVKCRLLECLDRLLRQRVLDIQNEKKKKSHQNYRFARQFIFEFHSKL